MTMRIIVSIGFEVGETLRLVEWLHKNYPGSDIDIIRKGQDAHFFKDKGIKKIRDLNLSSVREVLSFAKSMLFEKYDIAFFPSSLTPSCIESKHIFLFFLVRAKKKLIITKEFNQRLFSAPLLPLLVLLKNGTLYLIAKTLSYIILHIPDSLGREIPNRKRNGKLGLFIYKIPDASHHFVYREVLELKKDIGDDAVIISLLKGEEKFSTSDTRELNEMGISFFPDYKTNISQILIGFIKAAILNPLITRRLLGIYKNETDGRGKFISPSIFSDHYHPLGGFHLAELLKKQRISHLHVYGSSMLSNYAFAAFSLTGIPFSFTAYVDFDYSYPFKMLEQKLKASRLAIVHTDFCKERLLSYYDNGNIKVCRIGLDLSKFKYQEGTYGDRIEILFIGNLVEKKGLNYLLKACKILKEGNWQFFCSVIGDGPLRSELMKLAIDYNIESNIKFLGAISNDEVKAFFSPEKILVQPSIYASDGERDGIPTVIIEAMAKGTAVISTNISGIPEAVIKEKTGILVEEKDADALAAAIIRLHSDKELSARLRAEARIKVETDYNIKHNSMAVKKEIYNIWQTEKEQP